MLKTHFPLLLRSWASSAFWRTVDTAREERWLNTSLRCLYLYLRGNHFRKAPGTLSSSTLLMILFRKNHFRIKPLCVGTLKCFFAMSHLFFETHLSLSGLWGPYVSIYGFGTILNVYLSSALKMFWYLLPVLSVLGLELELRTLRFPTDWATASPLCCIVFSFVNICPEHVTDLHQNNYFPNH